ASINPIRAALRVLVPTGHCIGLLNWLSIRPDDPKTGIFFDSRYDAAASRPFEDGTTDSTNTRSCSTSFLMKDLPFCASQPSSYQTRLIMRPKMPPSALTLL